MIMEMHAVYVGDADTKTPAALFEFADQAERWVKTTYSNHPYTMVKVKVEIKRTCGACGGKGYSE